MPIPIPRLARPPLETTRARPTGFRRALIAAAATMLIASPAASHEFWLEAEDYTVASGEPVRIDLRVGQGFRGDALPYNPASERRTALIGPDGEAEVTSRIGDRPAIDQPVPGDGLLIAVHETGDTPLTYKDAATFETFVTMEGLDGTLERHAKRGLPPSGFTEVFSRSVKALVSLGEEGGADRALGLAVEIVVEGDPYAEPLPESVTLVATADDEPMAGALINVFTKPQAGLGVDEKAGLTKLRTDEAGRATLPLEPGLIYLANVVDMREASAKLEVETGAVWESRWGSTTFSTGE